MLVLCAKDPGENEEGVIRRSMEWYVDEFDQKVPWKSTDYVNVSAMNFVSFVQLQQLKEQCFIQQ